MERQRLSICWYKSLQEISCLIRQALAEINSFLEEHGRRIFLTYLRPIINGVGNYYVEARTRDLQRTDIVSDYLGCQYVVELKIWHGEEYNRRGELQLAGYLDSYALEKGYLLSFNFNKNKKTEKKEIHCNGKTILEIVV